MTISNRLLLQISAALILTPAFGWLYFSVIDSKVKPDQSIPRSISDAKQELSEIEEKLSEIHQQSDQLEQRRKFLKGVLSGLSEMSSIAEFTTLDQTPIYNRLSDSTKTFLNNSLSARGKPFLEVKQTNDFSTVKFDGDMLVIKRGGEHIVPYQEADVMSEVLEAFVNRRPVAEIKVSYGNIHESKLPRLKRYLNAIFDKAGRRASLVKTPDAEELSVNLIYESRLWK